MEDGIPKYDYSAGNLVRPEPPWLSVSQFQHTVVSFEENMDMSFLDTLKLTEQEQQNLDIEFVTIFSHPPRSNILNAEEKSVPDDVKYRTPHEHIDAAIRNAIVEDCRLHGESPESAFEEPTGNQRFKVRDEHRKHLSELHERAQIPHFQDLVLAEANSTLFARKHLDLLRNARVNQTIEREINYNPDIQHPVDPQDPLDPHVALIHFAYYHPKRNNQKMSEIVALSTNTLAELRDKLYCLYDEVGDPSIRFQSGMFFIGNVFYDDTRPGVKRTKDIDPALIGTPHDPHCSLLVCGHPDHIPTRQRYSTSIIEWMKTKREWKDRVAAVETVQSMELTNISNIQCQIGTPYLYMHQGGCQHLLVITDIRMPNQLDYNSRSYYPLIVFQGKLRRRKCYLCDTFTANYVTYDDMHAPTDPCFWCESCFKRMHYDETNNMTYEGWRVYPYNHE